VTVIGGAPPGYVNVIDPISTLGQYRSHFAFPFSTRLVVITMHLLFDSHTIRTKLDADPFVGPELKVAQSKQKK
jgi:hypothetical protein